MVEIPLARTQRLVPVFAPFSGEKRHPVATQLPGGILLLARTSGHRAATGAAVPKGAVASVLPGLHL